MEENTLRGFVARILGWSPSRADAVEHAIRSINLAVERSAALVLLGETDLVPRRSCSAPLHARHRGALRGVRRQEINSPARPSTPTATARSSTRTMWAMPARRDCRAVR